MVPRKHDSCGLAFEAEHAVSFMAGRGYETVVRTFMKTKTKSTFRVLWDGASSVFVNHLQPQAASVWICAVLLLALSAAPSGRASTAYGTLNNFDCVNDTGVECHGFEIEIEDVHSRDITYTYNYNHYGTPKIIEDLSDPAHPRVRVRYESARNANGTWGAYTAVPTNTIAATDGHQFTNPNINFGGEHFGVSYYGSATNISYHWLLDDGSGALVRGPAVYVSTPTFTYYPPVGLFPAQVQARIEPPPAPPIMEFGPAVWVKEIRTVTHNNREVKLRDLLSDDPDREDDKNWRNGEPDEVEAEWEILQTDFGAADGGAQGHLEAAPEDLDGGDEVVTRRWEFYKYLGPIDEENGEALAHGVGDDGIHGKGTREINGVEVDLSTVVVVGEYLGAQMSAFDINAPLGLADQLPDGVVGEDYPTRLVVIAGIEFTATNWGVLPDGLTLDLESGEFRGTPTTAGVFQFTVEARAGTNAALRRTYTITIAEDVAAAAALPQRYSVDTVPSPLEAGSTSGDGAYENSTTATVLAAAAEGYAFSHWSDNGRMVSRSSSYTFTNLVNRSLVANFVAGGPRLKAVAGAGNSLTLLWSTNPPGFVLQSSPEPEGGNWLTVTNPAGLVGTNRSVTLPSSGGWRFYRLLKP